MSAELRRRRERDEARAERDALRARVEELEAVMAAWRECDADVTCPIRCRHGIWECPEGEECACGTVKFLRLLNEAAYREAP